MSWGLACSCSCFNNWSPISCHFCLESVQRKAGCEFFRQTPRTHLTCEALHQWLQENASDARLWETKSQFAFGYLGGFAFGDVGWFGVVVLMVLGGLAFWELGWVWSGCALGLGHWVGWLCVLGRWVAIVERELNPLKVTCVAALNAGKQAPPGELGDSSSRCPMRLVTRGLCSTIQRALSRTVKP